MLTFILFVLSICYLMVDIPLTLRGTKEPSTIRRA